jgi:cation diffusion facilitator CzcD-associated flavoprotein CzcO
MSKDNGGPAFPLAFEDAPSTPDTHVQYGMTLRDYMAIHASESDIQRFIEFNRSTSRAAARYMHADYMLKARAQ